MSSEEESEISLEIDVEYLIWSDSPFEDMEKNIVADAKERNAKCLEEDRQILINKYKSYGLSDVELQDIVLLYKSDGAVHSEVLRRLDTRLLKGQFKVVPIE